MDVKAKRNVKLRGQAFVIFKDISSAIDAMKNVKGMSLYNKQIVRLSFFYRLY